jgi:hypothetical protein
MKQFQYRKIGRQGLCDDLNSYTAIDVNKLNELGKDGWELIAFTWVSGVLAFGYFKREIINKKKNGRTK